MKLSKAFNPSIMKRFLIVLTLFSMFSCKKDTDKNNSPQKIEYPESGIYGPNLLSTKITDYNNTEGNDLSTSLTAKIPANATLRLEVYTTPINNLAGYDTTKPQDVPYSFYGMPLGQPDLGWTYTVFDNVHHKQVFITTRDSCTVDMYVVLASKGGAIMSIYENGSYTPARVKTLKW
jgi:hypothetical protein